MGPRSGSFKGKFVLKIVSARAIKLPKDVDVSCFCRFGVGKEATHKVLLIVLCEAFAFDVCLFRQILHGRLEFRRGTFLTR